jgi:hypothetical protein
VDAFSIGMMGQQRMLMVPKLSIGARQREGGF